MKSVQITSLMTMVLATSGVALASSTSASPLAFQLFSQQVRAKIISGDAAKSTCLSQIDAAVAELKKPDTDLQKKIANVESAEGKLSFVLRQDPELSSVWHVEMQAERGLKKESILGTAQTCDFNFREAVTSLIDSATADATMDRFNAENAKIEPSAIDHYRALVDSITSRSLEDPAAREDSSGQKTVVAPSLAPDAAKNLGLKIN